MKIGDVFPPRSGFVQQITSADWKKRGGADAEKLGGQPLSSNVRPWTYNAQIKTDKEYGIQKEKNLGI